MTATTDGRVQIGTEQSAPRRGLSEQEKAERALRDSLGYLLTLARARAEATERIGPWRDKEPSADWWAELAAAESRNATEIRAEYIAALPLEARAPEISELAATLKAAAGSHRGVIATLYDWLEAHGYADLEIVTAASFKSPG